VPDPLRPPRDRRAALERGARAETFAAEVLTRDGWTVLARNWRARGGELDLVVERDGVLRFVEVKARDPSDDTGLDAIDGLKRRKLVAAAEAWLAERGPPRVEVAFLVAVVSFEADGWSIEWLDDAF
jgi:putative endonuclease